MHTLLAANDINNVSLKATFTINTISKFRTIQNHSRQYTVSHIRCQNIQNKYQKTLPLKSSLLLINSNVIKTMLITYNHLKRH